MSITRIRKTRKISEKVRMAALVFAFGGLGFMATSAEAASVFVVHSHGSGHGHAHPHAKVRVLRAHRWRSPVRHHHHRRHLIVATPPRRAPLRRLAHAAVDAALLLD